LNAKYAISIARKLGATIFVLPEDIVEVSRDSSVLFTTGFLFYKLGSSQDVAHVLRFRDGRRIRNNGAKHSP